MKSRNYFSDMLIKSGVVVVLVIAGVVKIFSIVIEGVIEGRAGGIKNKVIRG